MFVTYSYVFRLHVFNEHKDFFTNEVITNNINNNVKNVLIMLKILIFISSLNKYFSATRYDAIHVNMYLIYIILAVSKLHCL